MHTRLFIYSRSEANSPYAVFTTSCNFDVTDIISLSCGRYYCRIVSTLAGRQMLAGC